MSRQCVRTKRRFALGFYRRRNVTIVCDKNVIGIGHPYRWRPIQSITATAVDRCHRKSLFFVLLMSLPIERMDETLSSDITALAFSHIVSRYLCL